MMDGVAGTANVVGNDELLLLDDGNCDVCKTVGVVVLVSRRLGIVSVCNDNNQELRVQLARTSSGCTSARLKNCETSKTLSLKES